MADKLYRLALHEWTHIAELQEPGLHLPLAGRRVRWKHRPEEIRAMNATNEAIEKGRVPSDDVLLEFGIAYEEASVTYAGRHNGGESRSPRPASKPVKRD